MADHAVPTPADQPVDPPIEDAFSGLPDTARRIVRAAVEAFAARGFHATTTRDIATGAGLSPAGLYVHYPSKAAVLGEVSRLGHERALALVQAALSGSGTSSRARIARLVTDFVSWHAHHHTTARVVQYELAALQTPDRQVVATLRRRIESLVEEEVRRGLARGELTVGQPHAVTRALLSLCVDVARWYDPAGREPPQQVADLYATLVLRMLGADAPGLPADAPTAATTEDR
ncbi:MAG TPA: TetR/AcrR family transcriptional regulator [Actinomycetales bacterium]